MHIRSPIQERRRRPEYRDNEIIKPDTRKIALEFLSHNGFIHNPVLYTLLRTGWTEQHLADLIGVRSGQPLIFKYIRSPGSMPYRYHTRMVHALAAYMKEEAKHDPERTPHEHAAPGAGTVEAQGGTAEPEGWLRGSEG